MKGKQNQTPSFNLILAVNLVYYNCSYMDQFSTGSDSGIIQRINAIYLPLFPGWINSTLSLLLAVYTCI